MIVLNMPYKTFLQYKEMVLSEPKVEIIVVNTYFIPVTEILIMRIIVNCDFK